MNVQFSQTLYSSLAYANLKCENEESFYNFIGNNDNYSYGNVSYDDFSSNFSSDEFWVKRKIAALPNALFSILVKSIYHTAQAIFKLLTLQGVLPVKMKLYHVGRDIQEAYGSLATLFNDRYGQYHLQESSFHHSCYNSWKIDLVTQKTKEKIANFTPQEVNAALKKGSLSNPQVLRFLSNEQLEEVELSKLSPQTIQNLIYSFEVQEEGFAHFKPEEVNKALQDGLLQYWSNLISDIQLREVELSKLSSETIEQMFLDQNENNKIKFANFQPKEVNKALQKGLLRAGFTLPLLSDDQLKEVELSKLSSETIEGLLSAGSYENQKERFALFKTEEVIKAFEENLLDDPSFFSDDQLKQIKLSELTKETVNCLFPPSESIYGPQEEEIKRFANLNASEVIRAFEMGLFSEYHIPCFSIEMIHKIDFSRLPLELLNIVFPPYYDSKAKVRWSFEKIEATDNGQNSCSTFDLIKFQRQKEKNKELFAKLTPQQQNTLIQRGYKTIQS